MGIVDLAEERHGDVSTIASADDRVRVGNTQFVNKPKESTSNAGEQ